MYYLEAVILLYALQVKILLIFLLYLRSSKWSQHLKFLLYGAELFLMTGSKCYNIFDKHIGILGLLWFRQ